MRSRSSTRLANDASSRSIASATGSVMFSATVSDENNAPCWNVTP